MLKTIWHFEKILHESIDIRSSRLNWQKPISSDLLIILKKILLYSYCKIKYNTVFNMNTV